MKRIPLILAALFFFQSASFGENAVSLISSDSKGVTLKFSFNDYRLQPVSTTKGIAQKVTARNCYPLMQKGMPALVKMGTSITLPNKGNFTVSVLSEKHTDLDSILIAPSKGNLTRNVKPEQVVYTYGDGYRHDEYFPKELMKANTPHIARSIRGCAVDAHMMQYNPVKKSLRIYSEVVVRIEYNDQPGINELNNPKPTDREFETIYQRQYLNYNAPKYSAVDENGELLVICCDSFMNTMQPFVTHKQKMGIPTILVASSVAGTTSTEIKTYINNYYTNPSHQLKYVLLVGDHAQIASTILHTSGGEGGSDNSYSYLTGNDHYPEIFVGRFSAETKEQVKTMVERTILYENDPAPGNWLSSGLGIASSEGTGDNDEYDYSHIRNIRSKLKGYTYTSIAEEYDGDQGGNDAPDVASANNVASILNQGVGIISYCGHGDWNMFVSSGFDNPKVDALQNKTKWPFIFSVACLNGNFTSPTQTCFAEHWLRASQNGQPTGAVATVMSSINQPWNPPMKGQDEMVNILTESYNSNIKRSFGGITTNAMMSMLDAYGNDGIETIDTWNLFGDPSLMIRTAEATDLTITHPSFLMEGSTSITCSSAIEGARVSLRMNGILLGIATITGGEVQIPISQTISTGIIEVTGTAYNKRPYHGSILMIQANTPFVGLTSTTIQDVTGNNNQLADYGDTVLLNVTLKNYGSTVASNVMGTLSNEGIHTTIIQNNHEFGDIGGGDSTTANGAFKVAIDSSVPDQTTNHYTIAIATGGELWSSNFSLVMNAPKLKTQPVTIDDEGSATENNALDVNESATLAMPLTNVGHANGGATSVTLTTTSPDVSIANPLVTFPTLNANTTQTASFQILVSPTAEVNTSVPFTLISRCGEYSDTTVYHAIISSTAENWETGNFTKYAWINDAAHPWTLTQTDAKEGFYCAKSGSIEDKQTSSLQISINVLSADSITFWQKVSSETGYDYLKFFIQNTKLGNWSGDIDWTRSSYPVTPGFKTFQWIYSKDDQASSGNDCAWIDFVSLPKTQSSNGLENEASNIQYSVTPNPVKETLSLHILNDKTEEFTVCLLDITGKQVCQTTTFVTENRPNSVDIPTSSLASGAYFVNVNSFTSQKCIKVMIVH